MREPGKRTTMATSGDEADHCSHDIESIRLVPSVPQPHSNEHVMNIPPEAAYVRPGRRPLR